MPEGFGDDFRLIHAPAAHGTNIHLDQPDDIRILGLQEFNDLAKVTGIAEQVTRPRTRHVRRRAGAYSVADVIGQEAHSIESLMPGPSRVKPHRAVGARGIHLGFRRD